MNDIVKKSKEKNSKNITNEKRKKSSNDLKRICPYCLKEVTYTTKWSRDDAVRKNKMCKGCKKKLFRPTKEQIEKQRSKIIGRKHTLDEIEKISQASKKYIRTKEWYDKIAKSNRGKKRTPESIQKIRLARINYIKSCHGQFYPTYNKNSCQYFEQLEKEKGWDGKYATKNGEYFIDKLGYWVDYYEPNQNIVIEWDEPKHYDINGNLIEKDVRRMNEIKRLLGCKFFRYREEIKELKEW